MATKLTFIRDFAWPIGLGTVGAAWMGWGFVSSAHDLYTAGIPEFAWNLIGLAILLVGFVVGLYTVSSRQGLGPIHVSSAPQDSVVSLPRPAAAARKVFQNEELRPWDLTTAGGAVISEKVFIDCILYGPAMVTFLDGNHLDGIIFEGDPEAFLLELPEGHAVVIGVYGFRRCRFERCRFVGIGAIGNQDMISAFRAAMTDRRGQ